MKHSGYGRCDSCDVELTDYEISCKDMITGEYVGLCGACCKAAKLQVAGNIMLLGNDDFDNYEIED